MHPVKAEENNYQEEIVVLDESKINVDYAKHFAEGDFDGDKKSEVITFKSYVKDSGAQWILNTYQKDMDIWYPVLSKNITGQVSGHIYKIDVGNFDNDLAQEIIIASWEAQSSKIFLLDYSKNLNDFTLQTIYEMNSRISDLEVHSTEEEFFDRIYILYSDNVNSPENFATNVMLLECDENGIFNSDLIYSESKIYWSMFAIGQFLEQEPYKYHILLYQYKTTGSKMLEAFARIISTGGDIILDDIYLGTYSLIRDIVAWDRNMGDTDELCILDLERINGVSGFTSKMIYCKFNNEGLLIKEERLIDSNNFLNQLCIEKLDGHDDKLLILDPILGTMTYARFFDEEARDWYDSRGYYIINWAFDGFIDMYELDLDIIVSSSGDYDYTSSGATTDDLYWDFYYKVNPVSYNANVAISVSRDEHSDWWVLGKGLKPGVHSMIFTDLGSDIICHEVGHNYGLYTQASDHCPNLWCIMTAIFSPSIWDFCDTCESYIDKDKFGQPPGSGGGGGGGGCPILYTFNGTEYIEEGLLDIHNIEGNDKIYIHALQSTPYPLKNKIYLQLLEHPKTISTIDHIRLYGRLENGRWEFLHLKSAIHSTKGEIKSVLKYSDDLSTIILGEDHNNGISEFIDLEFNLKGAKNFLKYVFIIEGNNPIVK